MVYYCTIVDVGSRLGLDSAQRTRSTTKLTSAIRRATIDIDQCFRDMVEMFLVKASKTLR